MRGLIPEKMSETELRSWYFMDTDDETQKNLFLRVIQAKYWSRLTKYYISSNTISHVVVAGSWSYLLFTRTPEKIVPVSFDHQEASWQAPKQPVDQIISDLLQKGYMLYVILPNNWTKTKVSSELQLRYGIKSISMCLFLRHVRTIYP